MVHGLLPPVFCSSVHREAVQQRSWSAFSNQMKQFWACIGLRVYYLPFETNTLYLYPMSIYRYNEVKIIS